MYSGHGRYDSGSLALTDRFSREVFLEIFHFVSQGATDHDSFGGFVTSSCSEVTTERRSLRDDTSIVDLSLDDR